MAPMAVVPLRLQLSCHLKKSSLDGDDFCQKPTKDKRSPHFEVTLSVDIG